MTVAEFSNGFDTLVDSYRRFKDFDSLLTLDSIEFDEYQKSLYLTEALNSLVMDIYNGRYTLDSFEKTEEVRRQLNYLVKLDTLNPIQGTKLLDGYKHTVFSLPKDCWYIIYEQGTWSLDNDRCLFGTNADIVPTTHDEYFRTIRNPFRGPNKRRILRLDSGENNVELVSSYDIGAYIIRYVSKPEPIVLANLELDNLSIDGVSEPLTCKLSDLIHQTILDRAVTMALSHRINTSNKDNAD